MVEVGDVLVPKVPNEEYMPDMICVITKIDPDYDSEYNLLIRLFDFEETDTREGYIQGKHFIKFSTAAKLNKLTDGQQKIYMKHSKAIRAVAKQAKEKKEAQEWISDINPM